MIATIIVVFLLTIISFTLGVIFTLFLSKQSDTFDRVEERVKAIKTEPVKIGVIDRPTAQEVARRGTIEEETEEEMTKELIKLGLKPKR